MSSLGARQREFLESLFASDPAPFLARLRGDARSRAARLAIHRANVEANFHDALASTHPVTQRLVGPAFFRAAAVHYVAAEPSTNADLHRYGEHFAEFLAAYPPALDLPYLADVARLEWARHEAYLAADAPPFDFEALARVAEEDHGGLRFGLHPAVRLVESPHPVLAIWEANQPGRDGTPQREEGPDIVLVNRPAMRVLLHRIDAREARFIRAIAAGATLAQIASDAADTPEDDLAVFLRRWIEAGAIARWRAGAISPLGS